MKDQVPENVKKERVAILSQISREIRAKILDEKVACGDEVEVLFETCENGYAYGHTNDFIEVRVKTDKNLHGCFRNVKPISHSSDICDGILTLEHTKTP